jgi:hypothetical protein
MTFEKVMRGMTVRGITLDLSSSNTGFIRWALEGVFTFRIFFLILVSQEGFISLVFSKVGSSFMYS